MGAFGDLQNQVENAVNAVGNLITGASGGNTPQYPITVPDRAQITNEPGYDDGSWKKNLGYGFEVVRVAPNGGAGPAGGGWQEFRLQINPQELSQDEIFAIEVTPTLRGVVVEHHGTILKDIIISGTTGISPLRSSDGANKNTGKPLLGAATSRSGFEEFNELRSYFRTYVEHKRLDQREKGELRMVFKNFKDGELLYVEPQKFSMKRSAQKPFMYDYVIAMKGIGIYTPGTAVNTALSFLQNVDKLLASVTDTLSTAVAVINGAVGIITRVERAIANAIIAPLTLVIQAIAAVRNGVASILSIPRGALDQIVADLKTIGDNLADAFGISLGSPSQTGSSTTDTGASYNSIMGRTSTLVASTGRTPTYQESQVMNAFTKSQGALLLLASQTQLFQQSATQQNAAVVASFNNLFTIDTPNTVQAITILGDDDLQTIAARELGDVDKFRDIIVLNNLKPPYISATPGPGVLSPGSTILLPSQNSALDTGVKQNKIYNIQKTLGELERALGVDILLTADGDISISNVGDASLVGGINNFGQAVSIKLFLELGSLKRHPGVGTDLGIGRKTTTRFLNDLKGQILASLSQDPRVESVPALTVSQQSGTTSINMLVKASKIAQPVPIPLNLNVG
jgi:hypothetical protein